MVCALHNVTESYAPSQKSAIYIKPTSPTCPNSPLTTIDELGICAKVRVRARHNSVQWFYGGVEIVDGRFILTSGQFRQC